MSPPRVTLRLLRGLLVVIVLPWIVVCVTASRDGLLVYWIGVAVLGALAWGISRGTVPARWGSALELVGWNALLLFLILEAGTRLYLAVGHPPGWLVAQPDQFAYRLDPSREWLGTRPNSAGFYDEEFTTERIPGVTRIVALGDSYAVGMVPFAENYLTLVDAALGEKVQIYNLGVVHMAPRQYLEILESDGLALKPDVVLVDVFLGNDIRPDPPRGLLSGWASAAATSFRRIFTLARKGEVGTAMRLQQVFRQKEDGKREELPTMSVDEYERSGLKHLQRLMGPPKRTRERLAWRDTERALEDLVALCRARGIRVLATLAPDEIQISRRLFARVTERFELDPSRYDLEYPTRRVRAKLESLGVPVLDLSDALRTAEATAPTYHKRGVHWNRFGNAVVARALAPWLWARLAGH